MADLARYIVRLEAQTAKYEEKLARADKKLNKFQKRQVKALDRIKSGFTNLAKSAAIGFAAVSAGSLALVRDLDKIAKAAKDANVGVETFQAWEFAASQAGVSTSEFNAALGRASRRIGLFATDGSGPAAKSLQQFGIAVRDSSGNVRDQENIIRDYVQAMESLGSAQERTAAITALFGDDARKLNLVFGQGTASLSGFEEQARSLGIIIDSKTLKASENLVDQFDILSRVLKAGLAANFSAISGIILNIGNAAIKALPHIQNFFDWLTRSERFKITSEITALTAKIKGAQAAAESALSALRSSGESPNKVAERELILQQSINDLLEEREAKFRALSALDAPADRQRFTPLAQGTSTPAPTTPESDNGLRQFGFNPNEFGPQQDLARLEEIKQANRDLIADTVMTTQAGTAAMDAFVFGRVEAATEAQAKIDAINERARDNFNNLFGQNMVQAAESGFDGILKAWANTIQQMVAQLISSKIFDLLAGIGGGGAGSFGGAFASLFGGARAAGGPVSGGRSYLVGERGPELFTPGASGNITPNNAMGGTVINVNAPNSDAGVIPRIEAAVARAVSLAAQNRLESKRRGQ